MKLKAILETKLILLKEASTDLGQKIKRSTTKINVLTQARTVFIAKKAEIDAKITNVENDIT